MIKLTNLKSMFVVVSMGIASQIMAQTESKIQVGLYSDAGKAQSVLKQLNDLGYGPAAVEAHSQGSKVFTKTYPSYAEANFAKPDLRNAGFPDAFIVSGKPQDDPSAATKSVAAQELKLTAKSDFSTVKIDFKTLGDAVTSAPTAQAVSAERASHFSQREQLRAVPNESASESQLADKVLLRGKRSDSADIVAAADVFIKRYPASTKIAEIKLKRGYWLITNKQRPEAKQQFSDILKDYPGTLQAGDASVRLGYLLVEEPGQNVAALEKFRDVASGKIPASDANRVDAIMRCAALYHRGKDLEGSKQLYLQIENQPSIPEEVRAFAMLQRAGLEMELAWNEKSTFAESRAVTDELLKKFPNVNKQTRATASIIGLESYVHEGDYDKAIDKAMATEKEWKEAPEAPIAFYWLAKCNAELGHLSESAKMIESALDAKLETGARFKDVNMESSLRKLGNGVYTKLGNTKKAEEILKTNQEQPQ